jgi:hypothetical protein
MIGSREDTLPFSHTGAQTHTLDDDEARQGRRSLRSDPFVPPAPAERPCLPARPRPRAEQQCDAPTRPAGPWRAAFSARPLRSRLPNGWATLGLYAKTSPQQLVGLVFNGCLHLPDSRSRVWTSFHRPLNCSEGIRADRQDSSGCSWRARVVLVSTPLEPPPRH